MVSTTGKSAEVCNMDTKIEIKEEPAHLEEMKPLFDQPSLPKTDIHNANLQMECKNNVCIDSKMDTSIEIKEEFQWNKRHSDPQPYILDISLKSEIDTSVESVIKTVARSSVGEIVTKKETKKELCQMGSNTNEMKPSSEQALKTELQDTTSCITGIDQDFPLIDPPRVCTEEPQRDSSYIPCEAVYVPHIFVNAAVAEEEYNTNTAYQVNSSISHQSNSVNQKQEFTLTSALKKHDNKKPHKCKICQKSFTFLSRLKIHNLIHSDKGQYDCKICGKIVAHLWQLRLHNYSHDGKKLHKCEVCEKSFSKMYCLRRHCFRRHNLIHQSRKTHICKICNRNFTKMSNLKRHSITHESKRPFKCETCSKSFARESDLKTHHLMHGGESPYKCTNCLKTFTRASNLKRHCLTHENKRLHKCEVCEKGFQDISHLKRHSLIHAGIKPHKCDICEKRFTQHTHLKRHNETHHKLLYI